MMQNLDVTTRLLCLCRWKALLGIRVSTSHFASIISSANHKLHLQSRTYLSGTNHITDSNLKTKSAASYKCLGVNLATPTKQTRQQSSMHLLANNQIEPMQDEPVVPERKRKRTEKEVTLPNKRTRSVPVRIGAPEFYTQLPDEVLIHIFSFLPARVLCSTVVLVSRHWAVIANSPYLWKQIPLDLSFAALDQRSLHSATRLLKVLRHRRFRDLRHLSIGHISLGKATLRRLTSACPNLEQLLIAEQQHRFTPEGNPIRSIVYSNKHLKQLAPANNGKLRELSVPRYEFSHYHSEVFANYSGLTKLSIESVSGSLDGLINELATHCKDLTFLRLGAAYQNAFRSAHLLTLAKNCPKLQTLQLRPCSYVTEEALLEFSQNVPNLVNLQLYQCKSVSDAVVESFAEHCSKLKTLELVGEMISSERLTKRGYLALLSKNIEACNIPMTNCRSANGAMIPELPRWSSVTVIFSILNKCLRKEASVELNITNKEFKFKKPQGAHGTVSPFEAEELRNGQDYRDALKLLFLAQRFEETAYQNAACLEDYLHCVSTKCKNCAKACQDRYLAQRRYLAAGSAQQLTRASNNINDADIKFLKEVLFVWFLGQTEPTNGSYRF